MANNLDVRSRDVRDEMRADDPLMELTRIMGLTPRKEGDSQPPVDVQLSLEDDFVLDLERELQLGQAPDVEPVLDDGFEQSFDEELSIAMNIGPDTPPVVPSLEDELSALLANEPVAGVQQDQDDFEPAAPEEPDQTFEPAPWLDASDEHFMQINEDARLDGQAIQDDEDKNSDPVLSQMNRIFGRSNLSPVQASHTPAQGDFSDDQGSRGHKSEIECEFEPEVDFDAEELISDPIAEMADFDFSDEELAVEPDSPPADIAISNWNGTTTPAPNQSLDRLVGKTGPEPVVESTEFDFEPVAAMDDLDIPDFDLPAETSAPDLNLDDDFSDGYQGYEPSVARVMVEPAKPSAIDDLALDMSPQDDESDLDFESMLNDELTASVDHNEERGGYIAGVGAGVASATAYRMQNHAYRDEAQDAGTLSADMDSSTSRLEALSRKGAVGKNTWLIAAGLAAIAVLGGASYYAMSGTSGGAQGNAPVLVKADPSPVKVAPETPGGKTVANQEQAVYDKVGGDGATAPSQGQLVSESEEPVDIASVTNSDPVEPDTKSEERVDPALDANTVSGQAADTLAVSPKKVRTVVVKPDGTLVERPAEPVAGIPADVASAQTSSAPLVETPAIVAEKSAPAVEAPAPGAQATATITPEPAPIVGSPLAEAVAKAADVVVDKPQVPALKTVKIKKIKAVEAQVAKAAPDNIAAQEPSNVAPVLESRPADQPVNIIGKTGKAAAIAETQVAAADPVQTPAPAGSYSIQIASTPSPEAAKSTYAALSRKFGGVLGGRGVNVQRADVAGKGTVYRVRIPAGSKQEAAALCQQYKSAGGNCFITK
jgi:hypothetical protein